MELFTQALDVLQNEEKMLIRSLLPTIKLLQETFIEFSEDATILRFLPLVYGVHSGIEKRFGDMFNNLFVTSTVGNLFLSLGKFIDFFPKITIHLIPKIMIHLRFLLSTVRNQIPTSSAKKYRFLDGYKKRRTSLETDEVDSYFNDGIGELKSLERFPSIKKIFLHFDPSDIVKRFTDGGKRKHQHKYKPVHPWNRDLKMLVKEKEKQLKIVRSY
ncbi:Uncharacterized protein APZ42_033802 [Daphnia magna]|uniref:Uncharacterized protein n=1 Tax=Daphnia magna TaxID=35525 RepID=A0A164KQU6_9CRUS|nr:Uncharacterized protein APZ42_033802 [Daphnia magna]